MAKAVKEWSPCFLVGEGCSDGSGSERQARFCQRQHGGDRFRHRDCVCPRRRARARQWPQPAVDAAIAEIRSRSGADAHGFAGDLSLASTAAALFRAHPEVEILVNNFGIFEPISFEDIADAEWVRFFEANVLSGVRLARLYLPAMRRANRGRIIFISSESAVQIPAEMIHYGMTKTAQLAVSRGLAEAAAGTGITVNSVLPGPTKSRGVDEFVEALARTESKSFESFEKEFFEKVRPTSLIKRFASPAEVASMVAYLASPLASATTGAAVRVDGGVIKSAFSSVPQVACGPGEGQSLDSGRYRGGESPNGYERQSGLSPLPWAIVTTEDAPAPDERRAAMKNDIAVMRPPRPRAD